MAVLRGTKQNEFLPGTLDMLVLRTLAHQPTHGYGIAQFIRQQSGDMLSIGEGSLYPALQRLKLKGYVASEWGKSDNMRRARFYTLTDKGRRQLEQEIESFDRVLDGIARVMQPV